MVPFHSNAQPGDERDGTVHREHLAMIAAEPAER
jgi:hypothetical protein